MLFYHKNIFLNLSENKHFLQKINFYIFLRYEFNLN